MGPQQDHQALGREPISKSDRFSRQQFRPIAPTSVSATAVTGADGAAAAPDDVAATIKSRKDTKNNVLGSARRHRVYDNIINQWKQAASSAVPKPRSSHPRVLGGEALTTRQRGASFSSRDSSGASASWGILSDTMSHAARSAWREQLLRRKLSRLEGVPMTVLFRLGIGSTAGGCRVVAAAPKLSAELTARAVIEGRCLEVARCASPRAAAERPVQPFPANGRGPGCEETPRSRGETERRDGVAREGAEVVVERGGVGTAGKSAMASGGRSYSTLPVKLPARGFHLVDLHAVVRNCVEWSHCLPKVEPCFRVGANRDGVLLGLLHALGIRLSCSSVHDIKAGVKAAHRISPGPAHSPRLLDRHVCRSPGLLRTSAAAGLQLYEVDSADEVRRIRTSRRKTRPRTACDVLECAVDSGCRVCVSCSRADACPPEVLIRLAVPFRSTRELPACSSAAPAAVDSCAAVSEPSGALEAMYGATAEDVAELIQAASATAGPGVRGASNTASASCGSPVPIAGFSIDVGPACWDDAIAAAALPPGRGSGDPFPGAAPGEAVPSAALTESIDAAVAFAVKVARHAVEAAAIATLSAVAATGEDAVEGGALGESGRMPAATSLCHPFSFRRLHVTGLGEGGARGEPLAALKASLSRHLPKPQSMTGEAVGAVSKPIVVSVDATEHLTAGGVWSTVTSIIGRKDVAAAVDVRSVQGSPEVADVGDGGGDIDGGTTGRSGAMYYIDDGCYGSLSGALLRGLQMQPSPLLLPRREGDVVTPGLASEAGGDRNRGVDTSAAGPGATGTAPGESLPCTVWGPTCDGLDCVSRVTQLPDDMEPGRDWLFFPDMGVRAGADVTDFNGLKPLDSFYCVRDRERSAPPPFPTVSSHARV